MSAHRGLSAFEDVIVVVSKVEKKVPGKHWNVRDLKHMEMTKGINEQGEVLKI